MTAEQHGSTADGTGRHRRRSLSVVTATALLALLLVIAAGSPVQAASTSFEVRIDHDGSASTETVREFAGEDRYDTALRLAKNLARSKDGSGAVPAVFLASGELLVDSISAAGLAGQLDAPILLTPAGSLHDGVAAFIGDYGVATVYVLGGPTAVSDSTVTALEVLASRPTVTRIAGDDRYETAVAIAEMFETESSWCGTDASSVLLINGATEALPFGVAAQTLAFRLRLPVLMTAADVLPDATAGFLDGNDIEHVQIIGGADVVPADVEQALSALGVGTVSRVQGDSAAAVSVALARLARDGCRDSLGLVSAERVALVRGNPDGVVAAPVLASSLTGGHLVMPLVVGDTLPAEVRDYLAATPSRIGNRPLNLGIVAVGGPAAISEDTMAAALEAAVSAAVPGQVGTAGALSGSVTDDGPGDDEDGGEDDSGVRAAVNDTWRQEAYWLYCLIDAYMDDPDRTDCVVYRGPEDAVFVEEGDE